MAIRECEAAHCGGADAEINEICKQEDWPIGHPVLTRDSQGPCVCQCSCFALNTPIFISKGKSKAVQDIKKGEFIYAAGLDLVWEKKKVAYSNGSKGSKTTKQPQTIFISFGENQHLVVLPDTLFLVPGKKMKRADKLNIYDDYLINENGEKITINGIGIGDFRGGFHHIATDIQEPTTNLDGHLIIANGVVCGDYTLQIKYHSDEYKKEFDTMLTVGTKEYTEKYGELERNLLNNEFFISSSELSVVTPPDDAYTFISNEDAKKHLESGTFRAFTDTVSRSWIEYLFTQYELHYPEINFSLDWDSEVVNAYAWETDGKKYVQIKGGLVRSTTLELEGLSLVLAHEIGHHYGGEPTYDGILSCEGQADFYGARNVMRVVWFGEFYIDVMKKAIKQLDEFFNVPFGISHEKAFLPEDTHFMNACGHPPGNCRIETYNAAIDLKPKPSCAG
ncbi:M48 family metalloprotease [Paenibacillus polymyxa]|uniref:M48 family metalloprotease n=1 Tax=Paenibacillus polymyxa TaxID=1406 RepID=UPI0020254A6C|nr:M48 family metalloprotease [Paenibacillus polymyxa]WDZ63365.1 M48 family metalloprotease [Paenibacillus polymyxa]